MIERAELEHVLAVARAAAGEAGRLVSASFRKGIAVERKGANDLVTALDRASEELIRTRLGAELPYAIVGEEAGGSPKDGVGLYVDPIDGTTNFVHGHPVWCISIGLVDHGVPVAGLVLAPVLGLEWSGWHARDERHAERRALGNAFVEGQTAPCRVTGVATIPEAYLATGFPYDRRTSDDDNFRAFFAIKKECLAIRRCGSAAMDLCFVGDGTYDGYWERKVGTYDVAAGAAIVLAAGGRVTDFTGGADYLSAGRIVATNGTSLHDALLATLAHTECHTT
ncbi:MAG: inositol monophosphatase family protein [Labilithrix sp.]